MLAILWCYFPLFLSLFFPIHFSFFLFHLVFFFLFSIFCFSLLSFCLFPFLVLIFFPFSLSSFLSFFFSPPLFFPFSFPFFLSSKWCTVFSQVGTRYSVVETLKGSSASQHVSGTTAHGQWMENRRLKQLQGLCWWAGSRRGLQSGQPG